MPNAESPYAGLFYCEKCHKTKPEKDFYGSNNLEKYPSGKLNICKSCISLHVDNWNPDTYTWILKECDVPYIPSEWTKLMTKYAKDAKKLTGATILGRYLAKMHLRQHQNYRWADSEFLQEIEKQEIEAAMKQAGKSAAEITQLITESQVQNLPEKPAELLVAPATVAPGYGTDFYAAPDEEEDDLAAELTDEDRKYLRLKWGKTYKPEEWIQLEKLYNDMMQSYDIQTAGHIDTLKKICVTSLKSDQLLAIGDVDGAMKMVKMYDTLMKSGKFTEAQNKSEKGEAVDSVSELVMMCEKQGFIPRYYTDGPQDKVDRVLEDLQKYTRTLVVEEMGLGPMIEKVAKQLEEDMAAKAANNGSEDEDEALEEDLFREEKEDELTADDLLSLMDQEDEDADYDENITSGETK